MHKIRQILLPIYFYISSCILMYNMMINLEQKPDSENKKNIVSAYIRVKDEIKTIEACLNSIDGVFDRIVIIHSNEKDDGSVAFMQQWCQKRKYCEIHEYPYAVIPAHHIQYSQNYKYENSLAAYYSFGLQFFQPEEWVVKIDADQVYIKPLLYQYLQKFKKGTADNNKYYGLTGYNTFVSNNKIVKLKRKQTNGGRDHYIIKRKNIDKFDQSHLYEYMKSKSKYAGYSKPVWFHFKKKFQHEYITRTVNEIKPEEIKNLSDKEIYLFETYIHPLLVHSPYYHAKTQK